MRSVKAKRPSCWVSFRAAFLAASLWPLCGHPDWLLSRRGDVATWRRGDVATDSHAYTRAPDRVRIEPFEAAELDLATLWATRPCRRGPSEEPAQYEVGGSEPASGRSSRSAAVRDQRSQRMRFIVP